MKKTENKEFYEELDLSKIREKIDEIDDKLVKLIEERFTIVEKVAQYKQYNNMKVFDEVREKEVIKKNIEKIKNEELNRFIEMIFIDMMNASKEYQKFKIKKKNIYVSEFDFSKKKIGYTGIPGSYAHEVLTNLLENNYGKHENIEILNFNSHTELVEALNEMKIDIAILPIENSIIGEVRDSIDLINKDNIHIIGEVQHKIQHNLLGIKGSSIENISAIYSHEQALMQCSEFLETLGNIKKEKMNNTALSAKYIIDINDKKNGCIANLKTKEMYNLELLKENINNSNENYTRFFIISNKNEIVETSNKISIITSTKNEAGALMNLLKILSKYDLNMVNLKSRPIQNKPWQYYFYIDFEGNLKEENVKNAIKEIQEKSEYLKILGNYKVYNLEI